MAEERDPQVSRRYRELGAEEPPAAIDDSILSASRRAVAPRRRWYVPLAAAAVTVLAVAVAVQVERQRPDSQGAAAPSAPQPRTHDDAVPAKPAASVAEPKAAKREAPPELMREAPARQERRSRSEESAPAPQAAPEPRLGAAAPASKPAHADAIEESPERRLEQIAELRKQGRHEEADQALADFKRRHPDYVIPAPILERIRRK